MCLIETFVKDAKGLPLSPKEADESWVCLTTHPMEAFTALCAEIINKGNSITQIRRLNLMASKCAVVAIHAGLMRNTCKNLTRYIRNNPPYLRDLLDNTASNKNLSYMFYQAISFKLLKDLNNSQKNTIVGHLNRQGLNGLNEYFYAFRSSLNVHQVMQIITTKLLIEYYIIHEDEPHEEAVERIRYILNDYL